MVIRWVILLPGVGGILKLVLEDIVTRDSALLLASASGRICAYCHKLEVFGVDSVLTFEELKLPPGFLTDRAIMKALENGYLIDRGTWKADLARHAGYTLRLGDHAEVCEARQAHAPKNREFVVRSLNEGEHLDLMSGDTAKLFSVEVLKLPRSRACFHRRKGSHFL